MKTAITIHIAERVFTIDEDAHHTLEQYLNQLRSYFASDATEEESTEIIADIENRIAEILEERLGESRPAVNMADIDHVMKEMGTVEDIAKEESSAPDTNNETKAEDDSGNWRPGKKLYRDPDNKVIGGVCAGLAAYFDVDVTFFRIAALLLLLLNGFGILVYVILWLAMPEAETASEKAAMHGHRANISNIEKNVKERLSQGLTEEDRIRARTGLQKFYELLRQFFQGVGRVLLAVLKIASVALAIALAIGGFLVLAAATAVFVQILVGAPETVTVGPITHVLTTTAAVSLPVVISAYVTIVFLGLFLMFVANSIFRKGKNTVAWLTTLAMALFFISAIVTANLGLRYWPQIEESYSSYNETITATKVFDALAEVRQIEVSGNVELDVRYAEQQRVELIADQKVIDHYDVTVENGVLQIQKNEWNDFCFLWCYTRPTQLHVGLPLLEGVELSGASDAYISEGLPEVEQFTLDLSGASYAEATVNAKTAMITASGSSEAQVTGSADQLHVDFSGSSGMDGFYSATNMQVELRGSSTFSVNGFTDTLHIDASGGSMVDGMDLRSEHVVAKLSGSSHVLVQALNRLEVDASGASTVRYYGEPELVVKTSGSSEVTPAQEYAPRGETFMEKEAEGNVEVDDSAETEPDVAE